MLTITTESKKGARLEQEDRWVVYRRNGTLVAVMDGHGGDDAASACCDFIPGFWDIVTAQDGYRSGSVSNVRALELLVAELDGITNEYHSGATLSAAFIPPDEELVYVAVLGDSPVIVRTPDGVCQISACHNARSNPAECEAAIQRGAIYHSGYIWNAQHEGLQMTRCLGDTYMGPILSRTPEVSVHKLGDFVLVGSDGLFDPAHKNPDQAIADVVALIDKGADAAGLVSRAVSIPTGDNATAILVRKQRSNDEVTQ